VAGRQFLIQHKSLLSWNLDEFIIGLLPWKHLADSAPLKQLDELEHDFVATRYQQGKSEEEFRNYKAEANPTVTESIAKPRASDA